MVESQTPLATQCLEFCQTLTSKGHAFTFNLTLGSSFSFSLDTKMKITSLETKKKKKSPSTMRRNLKRKEDYLKRKEAEEKENSTDMEPSSQVKKTFKCSQCDNDFKSENGLKIHIGKAHKSSDPPTEKLRDAILPALKPLVISPIRETRIIHCNNCDGLMSPNHTCDLEEIPDPSPKPPKKTCNKCFSTPPFSKCTQHLCRQCCSDMMCFFKKGHDTWWLSKPSYENVIQLWPKGQLWPGESTENQFF